MKQHAFNPGHAILHLPLWFLPISLASLSLSAPGWAAIADLRITEVSPLTDQAEVMNTGNDNFNAGNAVPFCHRLIYTSEIPVSTNFDIGERKVFTVSGLNNTDSDIWLYRNASDFSAAANLIQGVKYGPQANVGRASLATTAGVWPSATAFTPAPAAGQSLVWDEFGFTPGDWYIDETPTFGSPDSTVAGSVPNAIAWPEGTQDFENVSLGDTVDAIESWPVVDDAAPGAFTVRAVHDVLGVVAPRPGSSSTRWLRIMDGAPSGQNRFYSQAVITPSDPTLYRWTFHVNLETTPPGGADAKPRIVIQHLDGSFANAWGFEFSNTGASLIVTGIGGTPDSTPLYSLSGATGLGQWVELALTVNFNSNTVIGRANSGTPVSLPINLSGTAEKGNFRFCYRGEGTGNTMRMLIDDINFTEGSESSGVAEWVRYE